jgi:undecaprenyl-diphosphatase
MEIINKLNDWDIKLFLEFNSHHNAFFDFVMYWFSDKFIWFPLYAWLIYKMLKHYKKYAIAFIFFVIVMVVLSDQISSGLIKHLVQRLRPCHNPDIAQLVHLSTKGCGGAYGFVSSHAANAFTMAIFVSRLLKEQMWLKYTLFAWAAMVAYSRVYNGVHYPGDIICGGLLGLGTGYVVSEVFLRYYAKKKASFPAIE